MDIMHPHPLPNDRNALIQFWQQVAQETVEWIRPWDNVLSGNLHDGAVRWFSGAQLNVSVNCIDRHLPHKAQHPAIIWQGDEEQQSRILSFAQLHEEVCRMANALKKLGVHKGDVVAIYLPMIPEAAIAMLACARIGAIHTVVFAGFSAHSLRQRLIAADCRCLITSHSFQRGGKTIAAKAAIAEAKHGLNLSTILIPQHASASILGTNEYCWHELRQTVSNQCLPETMAAEDPLFILYTSGSTGQPKGLVHTTGGYLVQTTYTHQLIFACQGHEVFWCTADIGWITGHSYVVYGSLSNGITSLMYEGIPTWPEPDRNWRIIDKYQVNVFYTAPTAIRSLMNAGDQWLDSSQRNSLRLLGSVGEPINPEAWQWYFQKVGKKRCAIVDTWWQTETGAIMLSPRATDQSFKPGAARQPIPGIVPVLLDRQGQELSGATEGLLAIKYPWPSMARTIAGDHALYCTTYLANGYYLTGDGARRDEEDDYWITGRIDDVINVSGHRLGTAEIESALIIHPAVAEAAVVGIPHDIKGQGIYAYVVLKHHIKADSVLAEDLITTVKTEIGAIAKPDVIRFVADLPKTRSGKIMRRILRKIAGKEVNKIDELGDLSTLANPHIVESLLDNEEEH